MYFAFIRLNNNNTKTQIKSNSTRSVKVNFWFADVLTAIDNLNKSRTTKKTVTP